MKTARRGCESAERSLAWRARWAGVASGAPHESAPYHRQLWPWHVASSVAPTTPRAASGESRSTIWVGGSETAETGRMWAPPIKGPFYI
ncbi:hypothetical protein AB1Y20_009295 [Prymnesium parvum]|uniref:Uncharacterized protein n=1 Tax=Prymnesium parvum TaxID=97485 RepID=A0AB34K1N4_PRYPA